MTAAFDEFMRQYEKTGSEKADGYSRDAFIGLDDREKEVVFRMLERELPFSAEWLFFLDPKKALVVVKEEEEKLRKDAYAHVYLLQEQLIKHTGDSVYQDRMIEDYPFYTNRLKPHVVSAVGRTPRSAASIAFFKSVIVTEVNVDAVARATSELLTALGVPRTTEADKQDYKKFAGDLRSDSTDIKMRALRQIAKYEPNHHS